MTISTPTQPDLVSPPSPTDRLRAHLQARAGTYTWLFALLAVALMLSSGYLMTQVGIEVFPGDALLLFLAGVIVVGITIMVARRTAPQPAAFIASPPITGRMRAGVLPVFVGMALLAVVAEINGMKLQIAAFNQVPSHLQYALFTAGVLLVGWGFGGAPSPLKWFRSWREIDWREVLLLLAILGAALFLRVWQIDQTVRGLIDEVHFSDAIRHLFWDPNMPILTPMSGQSPFSWIFSYWQSGMVLVFGHTLFGFRILSPVIGVVTILALWGLARVLFDRNTALLAAILLAVFPPHLHFSRLSIVQIADPLFGTVALLFIARALKDNRRIDWSFAGVTLGLTQYFYEGGRLFFIPLALVWLLLLLATNRKRLRTTLKGIGIMVLTTVIVALPFYYILIISEQPLMGRMDDSGLGFRYWGDVFADGVSMSEMNLALRRLVNPFMLFIHRPEAQAWYYGGEHPLVLEVLVPVFLLGMATILWQWRRPAIVILLWPLSVAVANGLFIRDNIVVSRYVLVLPALALLMAVGLRYIPPLLFNAAQTAGKKRLLTGTVIGGVVAAICIIQLYYYFGPHLDYFNRQFRDAKPYRDGIDAVLRAANLPDPYRVQPVLVDMPEHDQNVPRNFHGYLLYNDPYPLISLRPDHFTPKYLVSLPRDRDYAFFVDASQPNVVNMIYRYFPNVSPPQYTTTDMRPDREYVLLFAPASLYDLYRPVKG